MVSTINLEITVNGVLYRETIPVTMTLLDFLRERLALTGAKAVCKEGECGACTVLLNNQAVNACLVLAAGAHGACVTTIEGLSGQKGDHPVQQAFIDSGAVQCGYCTPGMILSTVALLNQNPDPTEEEILNCLSGHICRCTGYTKIVSAVKQAGQMLKDES